MLESSSLVLTFPLFSIFVLELEFQSEFCRDHIKFVIMVKHIHLEENLHTYIHLLSKTAKDSKTVIPGLIFGAEISQSKTAIVHMSRTPKENSDAEPAPITVLENIVDASIIEHARQSYRMLPGGLDIVGLFLVTDQDPFSSQYLPRLRKLLTQINKVVNQSNKFRNFELHEFVVCHIPTDPHKVVLKTIEVNSISNPKPVELKESIPCWADLNSNVAFEFSFPINGSEHILKSQLEESLQKFKSTITNSLVLLNGSFRKGNELLIEEEKDKKGKKKPKDVEVDPIKVINTILLIPEMITEDGCCKTELRMSGTMCTKAYVHHKATVQEAEEVIKEDLLRSLYFRCEMHCDSLVGDDLRDTMSEDESVLHEPPRRVMINLPYSSHLMICDYLFPGEGSQDSLSSLADLMDMDCTEGDIQDYWEATYVTDSPPQEAALLSQNEIVQVSHQNWANLMLLSVIVLLIAIVFIWILK
uniref:EOG090X0BI6 n=1 Tax=Lynceus sp. MCZ IZ 141354 TaxID=1930659 RepID=A0A9N6WYS4_9CRUS|nr:EOG090X0BI6 [Lynceus sp. MCZ IZ 141354]